jgi:hypothetical protein
MQCVLKSKTLLLNYKVILDVNVSRFILYLLVIGKNVIDSRHNFTGDDSLDESKCKF